MNLKIKPLRRSKEKLPKFATLKPFPELEESVRPQSRHAPHAPARICGPGESALRQNPPAEILEALSARGVSASDILICTDTDIDSAGAYNKQWLIITEQQAIVLSAPSPGTPGEGRGEGENAHLKVAQLAGERFGPHPNPLPDYREREPEILSHIILDQATEFRCESVIGSGLLQARIDGMFVDILRYSNRLGDRFAKIARKLDRHRKGEPIVVDTEDEVDQRRCKGCGLMLEFPGEVCPRCVNKGAVMARMWELMLPYKKQAVIMMLLLLLGIALDLISPKLTQHLIDRVLPSSQSAAAALVAQPDVWHQRLALLIQVVAVLAGAQILRMGVNIINGRLGSKVGTAITFDMRGRLVQHLQKLSVSYYDRQQVGSLVGRVAYDTEALQGFVGQLTGGFVYQIIMVVLAGAMMFSIDVKLALYTLVPAPLVAMGTIIFWRYIYPRYYRFWDASSKQAGMLSGMLSGVRVVKAFGQEGREVDRFNGASDYLLNTRRTVDMSVSTFNPIMGLVFQLGGWIVWYVGGHDVLGGRLTLGQLMCYFGYLGLFYAPLGALTQLTNWLTNFVTQAHRIFEILDTPVEIADSDQPLSQILAGEIQFENVSFGYNRHQQVLKDINLHIKPGEMIGCVGRSGSGKSTLVNLICRFYDVNEGRVLMDGVDIREFQKDNLRSQIGVVLQEPFLFRGSIWDNVVYGRPESTPEEVIAASKAGNCHDFIMRQMHGYDTWVGERGAGLSGGERQRVSIARVLLTDPKILILDEATSSVDAESEAAIQAAMAEVVKGRTTIAIAHRLSTLRTANRIIVVDAGKLVQSGPHDELVTQPGLYQKLVKMQGQLAPAPSIDAMEAVEKQKKLNDLKSHHPHWLTPETTRIHIGDHNALHITRLAPCTTGILPVSSKHHGQDARDTGDQGVPERPADRTYGGVYALRCMPVKYPRQFISLRFLDAEKRETEVGLIRDLDQWPAEVQTLIQQSLLKRYFVHTVTSVKEVTHFQGYLNFDVETDLGPLQFTMRWQGDKAQDYGAGGKMLLDTEENRYLIKDVHALPERDRAVFQRWIYW